MYSICLEDIYFYYQLVNRICFEQGAKVWLFKFDRDALPSTREFLLDLLQVIRIARQKDRNLE
jgi:hypothetical protein